MDELWQQTLATAVLGTERAALPKAPRDDWPDDPSRTPPRRLLDLASALLVCREAGQDLPRQSTDADEPAPDRLSPCRASLGRALLDLLDLDDDGLILDWCESVYRAGQRAPEEHVPRLLRFAVKPRSSEERVRRAQAVVPVCGTIASWLIRQGFLGQDGPQLLLVLDAETTALALDDEAVRTDLETQWQVGEPADRRILLRRIRRHDPALGRAWLEASWDRESPEDRTAFLQLLAHDLDDADAPILERGLTERRKDSRELAAELLHRLPDSAFPRRMLSLVRPFLTVHKPRFGLLGKTRLEVVLPEDEEAVLADLKKDGVTLLRGKMGRRARTLATLLANVPIGALLDQLGCEPEVLFKLALPHEHGDAVLSGLGRAAVQQRHGLTLETLLAHHQALEKRAGETLKLKVLAQALPADARDRVLQRLLKASLANITLSPTHDLLKAHTVPWSKALSELVIEALKTKLTSTNTDRYVARPFLTAVGRHVHPDTIDLALTPWLPPWKRSNWSDKDQGAISGMERRLQIRQRLIHELATDDVKETHP